MILKIFAGVKISSIFVALLEKRTLRVVSAETKFTLDMPSHEKRLFRINKIGAFSSAGSEHLPYKQRVGGSNPSTPTELFFQRVFSKSSRKGV